MKLDFAPKGANYGNPLKIWIIRKTTTGWWLNQPIWKICSSKWVHLPQIGMKAKKYLKPPPSYSLFGLGILGKTSSEKGPENPLKKVPKQRYLKKWVKVRKSIYRATCKRKHPCLTSRGQEIQMVPTAWTKRIFCGGKAYCWWLKRCKTFVIRNDNMPNILWDKRSITKRFR